jgi:hypothetical protein
MTKKSKVQTMPLKVRNEGRVFAVTLAVSRSRAIALIKDETVAQGVLSVRRMSGEERVIMEEQDLEGPDFFSPASRAFARRRINDEDFSGE